MHNLKHSTIIKHYFIFIFLDKFYLCIDCDDFKLGPLPHEHPEENETMKKVGHFVKTFLTKFWIWVVAITLFSVAITGERMTSFRILYMVLFLVFLLSFQFSFRVWRKIMFGFWLTVIIYSMIILVLVYTYQFDDFNKYWTEYLHVSEQQ